MSSPAAHAAERRPPCGPQAFVPGLACWRLFSGETQDAVPPKPRGRRRLPPSLRDQGWFSARPGSTVGAGFTRGALLMAIGRNRKAPHGQAGGAKFVQPRMKAYGLFGSESLFKILTKVEPVTMPKAAQR